MMNRLKQPSPFCGAGLFPLVLFFCCGGAAVGQSGEPTWTGLGPEGGVVLCLAINPGDSTQCRCLRWRSTRSCPPLSTREPAEWVPAAGTFLSGMFVSTTGGAVWQAINLGLTEKHIASVAIDPGTAVYAGTIGGGVFVLK